MNTDVRSDFVALARTGCANCNGTGVSDEDTCCCVDRRIFHGVMNKLRTIAAGAHLIHPVALLASKANSYSSVGRKNEEFNADVYLSVKRTLTDPIEWDLFRYHYLLGADWKACSPRLGNMSKGNFFHLSYRMEAKLGKVFRELKPFPLFPVSAYFERRTANVDIRPLALPIARMGTPLRPPMAPRPPQVDPYQLVKAEIRDLYSRGMTLTEIAKDLETRGVRPLRARAWNLGILSTIVHAAPQSGNPRPVTVLPAPAPPVPFDPSDSAAVARRGFRAGRSFSVMAKELTLLTGTEVRERDIKRLLLDNPRAKRAA